MQSTKPTHVRYLILLMLFLVTTINYADRATIAIAGSSLQKDLGIDAVTLGYIFSAFGWAYVAGQIPGGWLLDRFGSKKVYALSIFTWSLFTVLQGYVGEFGISTAVVALFMLRFLGVEIIGVPRIPSGYDMPALEALLVTTDPRAIVAALSDAPVEPEADPLKLWLRSLDRLDTLAEDTLVLPSHQSVFQGLHARVQELRAHHQQQFVLLRTALHERGDRKSVV